MAYSSVVRQKSLSHETAAASHLYKHIVSRRHYAVIWSIATDFFQNRVTCSGAIEHLKNYY